MTTLDPKGIEAAQAEFFYWPVNPDSSHAIKRALEAYLQATDSVVVPREPTEAMEDASYAAWNSSLSPTPKILYRAMIQAAEGK